jgi:nucleotide-binding universal stress UspA family protein
MINRAEHIKTLLAFVIQYFGNVLSVSSFWYKNRNIKVKKKSGRMQIKKILSLYEFTFLSDKALEFTITIAKRLGHNEIILLNLIIPAKRKSFYSQGNPVEVDGELTDQITSVIYKKHLDLIELKALKFSSSKIRIIPVVRLADSAAAINELMNEFGADMMVCANHEKRGLPEIMYGSRTGKMVQKIHFPVIFISEEMLPAEIRLIAFAVNAQPDDDISDIADFARQMDAHIDFVHVNLSGDGNKTHQIVENLQSKADLYGINHYSIKIFNNSSLENGLNKYVAEYNPDIVAVIAHDHGKLYQMVFGSKTEDIIKIVSVPVWLGKER